MHQSTTENQMHVKADSGSLKIIVEFLKKSRYVFHKDKFLGGMEKVPILPKQQLQASLKNNQGLFVRKVNQDALTQLFVEASYTSLVEQQKNNKKIMFGNLYYKSFGEKEPIALAMDYDAFAIGPGFGTSFFNFLYQIRKRVQQFSTVGLPLKVFMDKYCQKAESNLPAMTIIGRVEESELFKTSCYFVKTYNDSILKKLISLQQQSQPGEGLWQNLSKHYVVESLLSSRATQKLSTKQAQQYMQLLMQLKFPPLKHPIDYSKVNGFKQITIWIQRLFESLSSEATWIYLDNADRRPDELVSFILQTSNGLEYLVSIDKDKKIMVRLFTDIKIFLEERDLRFHWINMISFNELSLGARLGPKLQSRKPLPKPPQGTQPPISANKQASKQVAPTKDILVTLFCSNQFSNGDVMFKIFMMMDVLLGAYLLLQPVLREYSLPENIHAREEDMGRNLECIVGLLMNNYNGLKSTIRNNADYINS